MTDPVEEKTVTHTPGPWTADLNFVGERGCPDVWQINAEHHAICTTQFCYAQETAANARLIAAAPDLLASCTALVAAMRRYEVEVDGDAPTAHIDMMREADSAIARATQPEGSK